MNRILKSSCIILLIILVTLISMSTVSNAGLESATNDAQLASAAAAAKVSDAPYFTFDATKLVGKTITKSSGTPYRRVGEYCIDNKSTRDTTKYTVVSIVDITLDGKAIGYTSSKKKIETTDKSTLDALRQMSYAAQKSIEKEEKAIGQNAWKIALHCLLGSNLKILENNVGLSNTVRWGGLSTTTDNQGTVSKIQEAKNNSKGRNYQGRFIFLYGNGGQSQLIFGATENEATGNLTIVKEGAGKQKLKNVGFIIKNKATGEYVAKSSKGKEKAEYTKKKADALEYTTNESGKINVKGLKPGVYELHETKNPNVGYTVKDYKVKSVTISAGKTISETIPNEPRYTLQITKIDSNTKTPIKGVEFIIKYQANKKYIHEEVKTDDKKITTTYTSKKADAKVYTTNNKGIINVQGLKAGKYEIYEIKNPYAQYEVDSTKAVRTINIKSTAIKDKDSSIYPIEINNTPTRLSISITKTDGQTNEPLPGVTFQLKYIKSGTETINQWVSNKSTNEKAEYSKDKSQAKKFTTDEDGQIKQITGLKPGTYEIYEIANKNPKYTFNKNKPIKTVKLKIDKTLKTITLQKIGITNTQNKPDLYIVKTDKNTGKKLSGVKFILEHTELGFISKESTQQKIVYTKDRAQAKEYETQKDGKTETIKSIEAGTYKIYETYNPYRQYDIDPNKPVATSEVEAKEEKTEDGKTQIVPVKVEIDNTPTIVDLTIIKTDKNTGLPLKGVIFKIRNKDTKKWISNKSTNEKAAYTEGDDINASDVKEFQTGEDGKIEIKGLKAGTYEIYETYNADPKYDINPNEPIKTVVLEVNKELETVTNITETIVNSSNKVDLQIKKQDKYTKKPLQGVVFKIKNADIGQYISKQTIEGKVQYTEDVNQAKEYTTNKDGLTEVITGLREGTYEIYEVYNPQSQYYVDPTTPIKIQKLELNGDAGQSNTKPIVIEIDNIPEITDLIITKIDGITGQKLSGVKFIVKHTELGYITNESTEERAQYAEYINQAKEYTTNENGEIIIKGVKVGTYDFYETYNPYRQYNITPGQKVASKEVKLKEEDLKQGEVKAVSITINNTPSIVDLTIIKKDGSTGELLPNVTFILRNKDTGRWVSEDSTEEEAQYTDSKEKAKKFVTGQEGELKGKIQIKGLKVGNYEVYEIENENPVYVIDPTIPITTIKLDADSQQGAISDITSIEKTIENNKTTGDLELVKKGGFDNKYKTLSDVEFIIQRKETREYVSEESTDEIAKYTTDRNKAKKFKTDGNGKIIVKGLIVGDYQLFEINNPHYGYEWNANEGIDITIESGQNNKPVINEQKYIRLSGYVWVDKTDGKTSHANSLYHYKDDKNFDDSGDILFNGVKVRLKDTSGHIIDEKTTSKLDLYVGNGSPNNGNGEYLFENVELAKLKDYYIEFEYDGLTYTNVIPHTEMNQGSKSIEREERETFNEKFASIEGSQVQINGVDDENRYKGITKDSQGNKIYDLIYDDKKEEHKAVLNKTQNYFPITASTERTPYELEKQYKEAGQEEIRYINLGLTERDMPDIALKKDLHNVKLTINGKEHTYIYNKRFIDKNYDGFNVGVKFGISGMQDNNGNQSYTRAIYKADYEYENQQDRSKELKTYITYRISAESLSFDARINSIVDYYDSRYTIKQVGRKINSETGEIEDIININDNSETYGKYKSIVLQDSNGIFNTKANQSSDEASTIYVQFELDREAIINILNDKANLDNVVEMKSYTVFQDGKLYAGINKYSNPGNAIPGETITYEADTDSAPALKLEVTDAREIAGTVFEDNIDEKLLKDNNIRQGNGAFDDGEKGIQGVEVTFKENSGSGMEYKATTDANGNFEITGYIPGDYTLTYTWGDEKYTVQHYKGTIYDERRNQNDTQWYKKDVDSRLTDAIDNLHTDQEVPKGSRDQIDEEMENVTRKEALTRTKMDSITPTMEIGIEYETTQTDSTGDKLAYKIRNVDFGIVERAKQEIALSKRVKEVKATLSNGQLIADLIIDENGKATGTNNYVTYMKPEPNTYPSNGYVKLELDNELIQGCTLEITYELKATNNSEKDYKSDDFYKYGKITGDEQVVKIKPSTIVDYLDNSWGFDSNNNDGWFATTLEELKELVTSEVVESDTIKEKLILLSDALATELEPGKSATTDLNISKILTTTDEIALDNEAEIIKVDKTKGSGGLLRLTSTIGNYVPGNGPFEADDDTSESVIVTPSTGGNHNYIIPTIIVITSFAILGAGVVIIKKKTLDK